MNGGKPCDASQSNMTVTCNGEASEKECEHKVTAPVIEEGGPWAMLITILLIAVRIIMSCACLICLCCLGICNNEDGSNPMDGFWACIWGGSTAPKHNPPPGGYGGGYAGGYSDPYGGGYGGGQGGFQPPPPPEPVSEAPTGETFTLTVKEDVAALGFTTDMPPDKAKVTRVEDGTWASSNNMQGNET